ncbi:hypothetical protein GCM10009578_101050 [Streptomyces rhizosphaericus]
MGGAGGRRYYRARVVGRVLRVRNILWVLEIGHEVFLGAVDQRGRWYSERHRLTVGPDRTNRQNVSVPQLSTTSLASSSNYSTDGALDAWPPIHRNLSVRVYFIHVRVLPPTIASGRVAGSGGRIGAVRDRSC